MVEENSPTGVVCEKCKKLPIFEYGCSENKVWWALECECGKTTPLYRSQCIAISVWEGITHNQSKAEAREKFNKESPECFTGQKVSS